MQHRNWELNPGGAEITLQELSHYHVFWESSGQESLQIGVAAFPGEETDACNPHGLGIRCVWGWGEANNCVQY